MMVYTHTYLVKNFWNGCAEGSNEKLKIAENGQIRKGSIRYCLYRALKDFTDRTARRIDAEQHFSVRDKLTWLEGKFLPEFVAYFESSKKIKAISMFGIIKCANNFCVYSKLTMKI